MEFKIEKINLNKKWEREEVENFLLKNFNLRYGNDADTTFVVRDDNDNLIATASRSKSVFKYFGICEDYTGLNLSGKLINSLMEDAFKSSIYHYFIFTSPDKAHLFKSSGFKEVFGTKYAVLLESGSTSIEKYLDKVLTIIGYGKNRGAIVMNLNPITLGHLHLIEEASKDSREVIIFVVEEDESVFPFKGRISMVRKAVEHLPNVKVIPGGEYIISKATFPTYFLKRIDDDIMAYTTMDAGVFSHYIAKNLGITTRYLGEEPFDNMTYLYNETLKDILRDEGIRVKIIERLKIDGTAVSASRVRKLLSEDNLEEALRLVPPATREYLLSSEGKAVIQRIKEDRFSKGDTGKIG